MRPGRGRERREARPARLRAVEGGQARRAALGDPVGPRPARLAPRVLGDGPQVPGPAVRHPRRRARPDLPAPRERDRPVQGGRRRVRAVLAAQRLGHHGRREDVASRSATRCSSPRWCSRVRPSCCATTSVGPALPLDDRVQRGGAARGRGRVRAHRGLRAARGRAASARREPPASVAPAFAEAMDDDLGAPGRSPSSTPPSARATAL